MNISEALERSLLECGFTDSVVGDARLGVFIRSLESNGAIVELIDVAWARREEAVGAERAACAAAARASMQMYLETAMDPNMTILATDRPPTEWETTFVRMASVARTIEENILARGSK